MRCTHNIVLQSLGILHRRFSSLSCFFGLNMVVFAMGCITSTLLGGNPHLTADFAYSSHEKITLSNPFMCLIRNRFKWFEIESMKGMCHVSITGTPLGTFL